LLGELGLVIVRRPEPAPEGRHAGATKVWGSTGSFDQELFNESFEALARTFIDDPKIWPVLEETLHSPDGEAAEMVKRQVGPEYGDMLVRRLLKELGRDV
jgi:hypothetical protein